MTFRWTAEELERRFGTEHFLVAGASGSGKSTLINHVLYSVIPDPNVRALIYDPKQELVPFLYGLRGASMTPGQLDSSIKILHPFDQRCVAWDMAADIDSPVRAQQLAAILVPDSESSTGADGFFTNAVRDILAGVLQIFIRCLPSEGEWTLRDVLLTLLYEPYRQFILQLTQDRDRNPFPIGHRLEQTYFGAGADPRTRANIQATINAKLAIYEPVAAAWHHATTSPEGRGWFSLRDWIEEVPQAGRPGSILVLGTDDAARAALDPINQALFRRASEVVLARPEATSAEKERGHNQIWFFLDEVREAGNLEGLGRLMTKGRSKNACVVMGFQDMDGMREVYGEALANEICAQFNNIAILRVNSPSTAQWATSLFGNHLAQSPNSSLSMGGGEGGSFNMNHGVGEDERTFLFTKDFLYGSNAAAQGCVRGFRKGPRTQVQGLNQEEVVAQFQFEEPVEAPRASADQLAAHIGAILGSNDRQECEQLAGNFLERPPHNQYLEPWTQDDWDRLGLTRFHRVVLAYNTPTALVPTIVF